jgi:UDPglucose 6-dehydrogenase
MMNISIIGTGYAGLSTGVGLASRGHHVTCMDIEEKRIEQIKKGISPMYEPGLEETLREAVRKDFLEATTDLGHAVRNSEVILICVPTPSKKDGSIDLRYIEHASSDIGKLLRDVKGYRVVAVKSTVVPGTTERAVIPNLEEHSGKKPGEGFGVGMVPEFLREGSAMKDVLEPDRIVIGELDKRSGDLLEEVHSVFDAPVLRTSIRVAEMVKYASNAFLATKVSFANEIGNMSKRLGIDVYEVMKGVGLDKRISPHFLRAGIGFGGSCFPKDVSALVQKGKTMGYGPKLLEEVLDLNRRQPLKMVDLLRKRVGTLKGTHVAVLGLAFKGETDDVRESPSIPIVNELIRYGARVHAYDPKAAGNFRGMFPKITYCLSVRDAVRGADACLVLTDWPEFRELTDQDFSEMKEKIILEGRKALNPNKVSGIEGVCW